MTCVVVSPIGKAKDSNDIQTWQIVEQTQSVVLRGVVKETKQYEIVSTITSANIKNATKSLTIKKIPIATFLRQHQPDLQGIEIGNAITRIQEWMANANIENIPENNELVIDFIKKTNFKMQNVDEEIARKKEVRKQQQQQQKDVQTPQKQYQLPQQPQPQQLPQLQPTQSSQQQKKL